MAHKCSGGGHPCAQQEPGTELPQPAISTIVDAGCWHVQYIALWQGDDMLSSKRSQQVLTSPSWVLVVLCAGACRAQLAQQLVMLCKHACARQCRSAVLPAPRMT